MVCPWAVPEAIARSPPPSEPPAAALLPRRPARLQLLADIRLQVQLVHPVAALPLRLLDVLVEEPRVDNEEEEPPHDDDAGEGGGEPGPVEAAAQGSGGRRGWSRRRRGENGGGKSCGWGGRRCARCAIRCGAGAGHAQVPAHSDRTASGEDDRPRLAPEGLSRRRGGDGGSAYRHLYVLTGIPERSEDGPGAKRSRGATAPGAGMRCHGPSCPRWKCGLLLRLTCLRRRRSAAPDSSGASLATPALPPGFFRPSTTNSLAVSHHSPARRRADPGVCLSRLKWVFH